MAGSPRFKVYTADQRYIGCLVHLEDAAAMVALQGAGATIRDGHAKRTTLWTEGSESISAGESYDEAATIMNERIAARRAQWPA